MGFSIRTRNVVTPRPNVAQGSRPVITAVSASVAAIATAVLNQWVGIRNTYGYVWWRGTGAANTTATLLNQTNASHSFQSAGTYQCDITATNQWGSSRAIRTLPIVVA